MKTVVGCMGKKICLFMLMGWLAISLIGCGPLTEDEEATAVLTDDFSSYTDFPASPWSAVGDSSSWTITSLTDGYAATFAPASAASSYLYNADFYNTGNATVNARMKIASAASNGASYGLYLRAASDLTSCYKLIFDITNNQVQILRIEGVSTVVLKTVSWSVSTAMASYYTYRFKIYGNSDNSATISAYVDGALVASATDSSPLTSGYFTGFFFCNILEGYIMRYQITEP